jgi:hypothetical protein
MLDRAIAQAVSHRPLTAEARARYQISLCKIYGGQSGNRTGFSPSTSVFPSSIIPPMLHTHVHLHVVPTRKAKGRSIRTFQKSNALSEIGVHTIESTFIIWNINRHTHTHNKKCLSAAAVTRPIEIGAWNVGSSFRRIMRCAMPNSLMIIH